MLKERPCKSKTFFFQKCRSPESQSCLLAQIFSIFNFIKVLFPQTLETGKKKKNVLQALKKRWVR